VACCCRLQTFISRLFRFFTSPLGNDEHIFLGLIFLPCSPATGSLQGDLTASVAYVILLGKKARFRRLVKRAEEFNGNICASVCNISNANLRIPRLLFFPFKGVGPLKDHWLPLSRLRDYIHVHRTVYDSSGREISSMQKLVFDNMQNSRKTNFHAHGGIRTDNPSKRAIWDTRLWPSGHWERLPTTLPILHT
jgi:hypothetical protein